MSLSSSLAMVTVEYPEPFLGMSRTSTVHILLGGV